MGQHELSGKSLHEGSKIFIGLEIQREEFKFLHHEFYNRCSLLQVVLCLAAAVACTNGFVLNYPGVYGYPGLLGGYHGLLGVTPYAAHGQVAVKAAHVAPLPYNVAPFAPAPAPVAPIQSQFHAQDELGQYSFGFVGGPSSRSETRDAVGRVTGAYNYVDSEGKVQTQHYVADALGFRVSGTNLPVAPDAPVAPALAAPEPVQDTPEVAAAKAAFKMAFDEAAAAAEAAPDTH